MFGRRRGTGKRDAGDGRVADHRRPRLHAADDQAHGVFGYARLAHQVNGRRRNGRRLRGRLGHHRVARGQRGHDLAGEDRERKIPGRDASEHAPTVQFEGIRFTRRSGQRLAGPKQALAFAAVVAAEVRGFAHLRDGVGECLARFLGQERDETRPVCLDEIGKPVEVCPAHNSRSGFPSGEGGARARDLGADVGRFRFHQRLVAGTGRIEQGLHRTTIPKVHARGIGPGVAEQTTRQRNLGMPRRVVVRHPRERIADQLAHIDVVVEKAIDEGRIGTVFQQPPHQVGEQVPVRAHGRIDAYRRQIVETSPRLVVEQLAHAVQTLEFVRDAAVAGEFEHRCHGMGVVGGELREDALAPQEPRRASQVGEIRGRLARVDRVAGQTLDLGVLDLRVPIGALDQPNHDRPAEGVQPVDNRRRALRVGLHRDAEAIPTAKFRGAGK